MTTKPDLCTINKVKKVDKKHGFKCAHCGKWVIINEFIGTKNRNHCPMCLWSKHVDDAKAGDRKSKCLGGMRPIGLTFKKAGLDKYGQPRQGELMLIHRCERCGKISINRIAADDDTEKILGLVNSQEVHDLDDEITVLTKEDIEQVKIQLFGR